MVRKGALFLAALLTVLAAVPFSAAAQPANFSFRSRSFINPFPQTERYHLYVLGDHLAEGLMGGLQQAFEKDGSLRIVSAARSGNGLTQTGRNWAQEIDDLIKAQPVHIAVVMMGVNDVRNMRAGDSWARWGTDAWRDAYAKEIDRFIKVLKDRSVAVYWVGLPVMANSKTSEAMGTLNDIIRERAYLGNVKFIDTWAGFTDQAGGFAAFGPDLSGQTQRLREPDGQSFTPRGNRKLANYVETILRRDLAEARSERNIPLAGDDEEQGRLIPKATPPKEAPKDAAKDARQPGKDGKSSPLPLTQDVKAVDDLAGKAGAKEGQPLPPRSKEPQKTAYADPLAGQPQQPPQGGQAAQPLFRPGDAPPGETIMGDLNDGVTSLATVSPVADLNAAIDAGERRLPVAERLFYRVLVKGEPVKPKPDRADDFKWPRS